MYQGPLYLVNYLYAGLLATKMFDMVKHNPAAFRKRYEDLLLKSFYAPPADLLRPIFGRDLPQQEWVNEKDRRPALKNPRGSIFQAARKATEPPAAELQRRRQSSSVPRRLARQLPGSMNLLA
jgi:hypothetical protein